MRDRGGTVDDDSIAALGEAVTRAGLAGASEPDLLREFCKEGRARGLCISRATVVIDTLHPVHEGRVFRWAHETPDEVETLEYGRTTHGGEQHASWQRNPFYAMLEGGEVHRRQRLDDDAACAEFPVYGTFRDAGQTDWIGLIHRFEGSAIGEMDCIYTSWTTEHPDGFSVTQAKALKRIVPALGLAIKSASLSRIAETLVETYLGRDAGRRVLSGRIERGVADRIEAALWFSDLRGFTRITGAAKPEEIIPFLNDYAEAVIRSVHEAGGDVLKLIGDGVLAIFTDESLPAACSAAVRAAGLAHDRLLALNEKRSQAGKPVTDGYLGLHVGEVFYGNVGSHDRLDFTVVGPAVNEASRIAAMCRSAERDVLASGAFIQAIAEAERDRFVSVGRYALRGVEQPQELFTLMPEAGGSVVASGGEPHPEQEDVRDVA